MAGRKTTTGAPVTRKRARWIDAVTAFVVLAVLVIIGRMALFGPVDATPARQATGTATQTAGGSAFSPAEQRIVALLPPGYRAAGCARS